MISPHLSALNQRSGEQRPILAAASAVLVSVLYGLALIALLGLSRGESARASAYLGSLREARLDLAKGFLHIVGATASDTPFDANRGHALADQGLAALDELLRKPPLALPEGSAYGLEEALREAERALSGARGAQPLSSLDATSLRIAFFDAERACAQLDALILSLSNRRLDRLDAIFWTATLAGGALLAGALIIAGREARKAALATRQLRASENRFRALVETVPVGIHIKDEELRYAYCNAPFAEALGLNPEAVLGRTDMDLFPRDSALRRRAFDERVLTGGAGLSYEEESLVGGESKNFLLSLAPLDTGGHSGILGASTDVSRLKAMEDGLRGMVRERDMLLKELHHRTKNNMQVISSILSLRASGTEALAAQETLRDISDRIMSMSLVHEKLYASADLSRLDLGDYLRDLSNLLLRDGPPGSGSIDLRVDVASVDTTIDTAIPVGLVVTELISNSTKHAFTPGVRGFIELSLGTLPSGEFSLSYRDSGPGLPEGMDPERSLGLGLKIIVSLIEGQLGGKAHFKSGSGFHFDCSFPELARSGSNSGS